MHIPGFAPQCRIQCRATDKGHKFLDQAPDEGHEFLDQAPEEGHGRRGRHGGGPRSSAAEGHGRRRISHKGHAPSRTRTPQEEVLLHKWDTGHTLTREDKAEIDALQESWRQQDAAKERRIEACMQEQEERRRKDSDELKRLRAEAAKRLRAADSVSKPSSQDPGGDDEIDRASSSAWESQADDEIRWGVAPESGAGVAPSYPPPPVRGQVWDHCGSVWWPVILAKPPCGGGGPPPPPPPPQGTQLDVVTERSVPPPPLPPPWWLSELNNKKKRPRPLSPPCTHNPMVTERSETPPPLPPPCTQLDVVTERSVPPPPLPPPRRLSERSEPPRPLSPPRRAEQARLADAVMQSLFEFALFEAANSPARAARPEEAADPAPRGPGVYLTEAYSSDGRVFEF